MLNIVTDFDGTVTDVQKEAETYYLTYLERLAVVCSIKSDELEGMMAMARSTILQNPTEYGWTVDGKIIAPATSDPYLFTQSCAMLVLKKEAGRYGVPPKEEWSELISSLFAYSYPKAGIYFREGALEYVKVLSQFSKLTVVTNSSTDSVERKLKMLLGVDQTIKVVGNAKKYKLDPTWKEVPESTTIKGLKRPVYLRRKNYANVLTSLGDVDAVCGDIWELDLALPERFGIYTGLILSDNTPIWEKEHYKNFENGVASNTLGEISDLFLTA